MIKTTLTTIGIAVALVLGGLAVFDSTPIQVNVPNQPAPVVNVTVPDIKVPATVVNVPKAEPSLGAVTGPNFYFDYLNVNGISQWFYSQSMQPTGSTTCSFKSPNATTTVQKATALFTRVASTTPIEIGWSAGVMATTTLLSTSAQTIIGGAQGLIQASSTAQLFIVPPNTYINTKIGSGQIAGTVTPTGVCKLVLFGAGN